MSEESFLFDKEARWLWISVVVTTILALIYIAHEPVGGRSGGTVFGYTSGCIAAAGMIFLMLYSKRKRSYESTLGTLKSWLSAHVWIGSALLLVVPLHSGFQFGCNVHTICYLFIIGAILTGIWGAFLCAALPPRMQARREGLSPRGMLSELQTLSADIGTLARNRSADFLRLVNRVDQQTLPSLWKVIFSRKKLIAPIDDHAAGEMVHRLPAEEQSEALKLLGLVHQKIALTEKFVTEVRLGQLLKIWLFIHLPLAVGGFTLLVVHVFSVFYRW